MNFLDNVISAATQVTVLYLIVAVGFVCDKAKLFTEKTARATVNLLLHIVTPCMLINSFITIEMNADTVKKFFISFAVATATHVIAIALNKFFFRNKEDSDNAVYKYASIYGNVGYMALPLAQAVLGDEGVFYCATGVVVFNIFCFTHGAALMNKGKEKFNLKKLILNPGVIAVIIGLPIFLLDLEVPYVLSQPLEMVGSLNTPIAMLIFGTYLANTDLKTMFTEKRIYLASFLKLIVLPLLCIGLYYLCGIRGTLLTACIITASVPSANNTFMFATKYERNASVASKTVALVSFISVLTMPVMIAITQLT